MDALDTKLNGIFDGKVVRKDLLHRIKKGTNVPTFVLEFLLARYCASGDPAEIQAGLDAVLDTLNDNYVRPNEANKAQSKVATKGQYRFIDKVHVNYVEKDRRHWAALENFDSRTVAISEKFYRDNDRLLQGGLWAEVTIAYNDIEDDDYAFYIEDLRPIQLSRFDYDQYCAGRAQFTRDEWMDVILRSVGLEPDKLTKRLKMHFIARLLPLVEPNFNFIELGPRSTGKSYFFSEFSPYSTLISGGQATKATLFYNNQRKKIGLVGFWDTVAFDEIGGIRVKDPDTIQIMKDFMANGRFSRGVEVIADASLAFVGNFDLSVNQVVNSELYDLFQPLPKEFDLAVIDRFACYVPGWEMPKNSSEFLTQNYGFITDYLAEAFHHQLKHTNRYEEVNKRVKLGRSVEGRDEKGIKKTVAAFLKILHPSTSPTDEEFCEYVAYAVECRRRVKEQLNKRKTDDEYAMINLSYIDPNGSEVVVYCPESRAALATQDPKRRNIEGDEKRPDQIPPVALALPPVIAAAVVEVSQATPLMEATLAPKLEEQHFTIHYGSTGYSYESMVGPYLDGAKNVEIEDPYIRATHQIQNFVRFCEVIAKVPTIRKIVLKTACDEDTNAEEVSARLDDVRQSLLELDIALEVLVKEHIHDREIKIDNGWHIKIGRGLDIYQKPDSWYSVGAYDQSLRKCLETKVDIFLE